MALLPEFSRNWTLKLIALILAILLWAVVKGDEPTRVSISGVPIEVEVNDDAWVLAEPPEPATVRVVFTGPVRELVRLGADRPRIILPVDRVQDSVEVRALSAARLVFDGDFQRTSAAEVHPATLRLAFDRSMTREVPVTVTTEGELPEGVSLVGPVAADPSTVRVTGARRVVEQISRLRLQPVDLSAYREPVTLIVPVDTAGLGARVSLSPPEVAVHVPAAEADSTGTDSLHAASFGAEGVEP